MTAIAPILGDTATGKVYGFQPRQSDAPEVSESRVSRADSKTEGILSRALAETAGSVSWSGSTRRLLNALLDQAANAASGFLIMVHAPEASAVVSETPTPRGSAQAALKLVEKWLAEDDGYDAMAWPIIQKDVEEYRLSERSRFDE